MTDSGRLLIRKKRRIAVKEPERTDLPRQTFYVDMPTMRKIKVFAAIDVRGVSEIVREALQRWVREREALGIEFVE